MSRKVQVEADSVDNDELNEMEHGINMIFRAGL